LLVQPGGVDAGLAINGQQVGLVLELPQHRLQVRPLPASCSLPGRSAEQRRDLFIEPELLPAFGRGRAPPWTARCPAAQAKYCAGSICFSEVITGCQAVTSRLAITAAMTATHTAA
jgi:hypothetical protein